MAIIRTLHDFLGKKLYPKTVTKAIYDDKGNRLDVKLEEIDGKLVDINNSLNQVNMNLPHYPDFNNPTVIKSVDNLKTDSETITITDKGFLAIQLISNNTGTNVDLSINNFYIGNAIYGKHSSVLFFPVTETTTLKYTYHAGEYGVRIYFLPFK